MCLHDQWNGGNHMKKFFAMGLAVLLVLGCLSGCGNNDQQTPSGSDPGITSSSSAQSQYTYQAQYIPVDFDGYDVQYINGMAISGDQVFLLANCVTGQETMTDEITGEAYTDENGEAYLQDIYEPQLFVMSLSGNTLRKLDYAVRQPGEGEHGYSYATGLCSVSDGSIWFYDQLSSYYFDLPEGFDPETQDGYEYYIDNGTSVACYHYDTQGNLLETVVLGLEEDQYLGNVLFTDDGIYATDYNTVYRYDHQGQLVQSMEPEQGMDNLLGLGDGIAISLWTDGSYSIRMMDTETMTLGEQISLPANVYNVFAGFGNYPYLYQKNGIFYGLQDGEPEQVLSWIDCDVDYSSIGHYQFLEDGTLYAVESVYDYDGGDTAYNLLVLKQVDASTLPQKQVLTLACMYLPWDLRTEIIEFNKSNSDVRITVVDYSQYATDGDYSASVQKLNAEILSGKVPDLFYINDEMPVDVYAAKGILQDIWPLIDADPELSREDLMTHFFDTLSVNGKLYQVTDQFYFESVVGRSDVIGTADSWTLEEMMEAYSQLQEGASLFGEMDTREAIFSTVISRNVGQFIDWESGQCSFDSQDFMDLLSLVREFPEEFDYSNYDWDSYTSEGLRMRLGMQLLQQVSVVSFNDFQYYNAMCDGNANYIGYPATDGCGSTFGIYGSLAISASCQNTDAAWQFVRQFLTEEYQTSDYMYYFPTNRHAFETYAENQMTPQYGDRSQYGISIEDTVYTAAQIAVAEDDVSEETASGEVELPVGYYYFSNDEYVEYYHMTQEEYDLFMELYQRTNAVSVSNESVEEIIWQECEAFFAGQKTVEETAKLIQNRVSLYVAEQS